MRELLETGVQIALAYREEDNALIGNIKGYSAAVRENLATGSYGVLMWIRKGEYAAVKPADEYLSEQKKLYPDLIKNFRVTDLGTAVALNRADDAFTNITNLKRFLYDFADYLSLNFYVNCCCECGAEEELSICDANGVIAQVCAKCGAGYRPILAVPAAGKRPAVREAAPKEIVEEKPAEREAAPKEITEEKPVEREEKASAAAEEDGFESLLFGAEEAKPEPPRSALFEETEREFLREQAEAAESAPMEAPEDDGFDDLMFNDIYEEPPEIVPEEPKRDPVPERGFSELLINDDGEVEIKKEEPEEDDGTVVTEIHDDSNDGAPIDVTEIESLVINPTVTTGHPQLDAEETPLGRDGKVPLVNPNANREEKQVSSPDGPDAVTPLSEDKNAYAASARSARESDKGGAYAVGYASADRMIDRDKPDSRFAGKVKREAPPPYRQQQEYSAGLSGSNAPPPYDPSSAASYYARHRAYQLKSNAFMGIIGALTCGAIGAAVWVLLAYFFDVYFFDMIGRFGGITIVFSTFGGYYLAGRSMDKKGIVLSSLLSLVMTFVGVVSMTVADIHGVISEAFGVEISFFDTLNWINYFVKTNTSIRGELLSNLGFSFLVTGISVVVAFIYLWRQTD